MARFRIAELRLGRIQPFGPKQAPSAIDKQPVVGPVMARAMGLDGDQQGDPNHHGGIDKAIHAYPRAHYPVWAAELPQRAALFTPGGFGENLVVEDVTEADLCLGDHWRVGGALLEVSQTRQPCWKLNLRFDTPDMSRRVQDSGRSGWYFRVVQAGEITAGDVAALEARPHPGWTLARVSHLLYHDRLNHAALTDFLALPSLPDRWRRLAEARLDTGRTEDWSRRLTLD